MGSNMDKRDDGSGILNMREKKGGGRSHGKADDGRYSPGDREELEGFAD